MSVVEKHEVVAAAAIKLFKKIVAGYKGPEDKFKAYLLRILNQKDRKADAILERLAEEIL